MSASEYAPYIWNGVEWVQEWTPELRREAEYTRAVGMAEGLREYAVGAAGAAGAEPDPFEEWGGEAGARRAWLESVRDGRASAAGFPVPGDRWGGGPTANAVYTEEAAWRFWRDSHLAKFEGRASPSSPVGSGTAAGQVDLHKPGGAYHMTEAQKAKLQWPAPAGSTTDSGEGAPAYGTPGGAAGGSRAPLLLALAAGAIIYLRGGL